MLIQDGLQVKVYFNLRKHKFSVQYKGRVIGHVSKIKLANVEFKVSESGRQRVLKERRKNVHAYVVGNICNDSLFLPLDISHVYYNPYITNKFLKDNVPVDSLPEIFMFVDGNKKPVMWAAKYFPANP